MTNFFGHANRSKIVFKIWVWSLIFIVFHHEFLTYWTLPYTWVEQHICQAPHCKKIMIISDPQILGSTFTFLTDFITEWDNDRYLRKTFLQAVNYLKPDLIIFLGDLMDQGNVANEIEYQSYLRRLSLIFKPPDSLKEMKVIIVPGDNDIGGVEDVLIPANVDRFNKAFNETEESVLFESIEFCKVNLMTSTMQQSRFINDDIVRVALSHVPLIRKETYFLKEAVKKIRPHLIVSGHIHKSFHYTTYENDVWTFKYASIPPEEGKWKKFRLHEGFIHEIIVPTCSYRMGVPNMGYGSALIDTNAKVVYYSVLWLPRRLLHLLIYLIALSPLILAITYKLWRKIFSCC